MNPSGQLMQASLFESQYPVLGQEIQNLLALIYGEFAGHIHLVLSSLNSNEGGHPIHDFFTGSQYPGLLHDVHLPKALMYGVSAGHMHFFV